MQLKNSRYVGQPLPRVEDFRLLTGNGTFVDDFHRPNMACAVIVRSPVAHGRLLAIDATAAQELHGVLAVLSANDLGLEIPRIPFRIAAFEEATPFQQPVIAKDRVRYVGEPVAVIIAESQAVAEDAAELIQIEIDELAPIASSRDSVRAQAPMHEDLGSNIAFQYTIDRGDAAGVFSCAPYKRKETFYVQRHTAVPMEMRGLVAEWNESKGHMSVWGAAKVPFFNRHVLAGMLGLPDKSVDLIELDVGGGFGVRGEFYPEDFLIPFAARRLQRPIKWSEDRREHLMATNHSREFECELEVACDAQGKVLGLRGQVVADLGAYVGTTGGILASRAAQFMPGPYDISALSLDVLSVATNKTPSGSYRGPGRFESSFARERLFDIAARDLGIDPISFRLRNLLRPDQLPYSTGNLVPYEQDASYDLGDHPTVLRRCASEIGWEQKTALRGREVDGRYHGIGFGSFIDSSGAGPKENCRIRLEPNGRISVFIGSSALGQGIETGFSQICADALEVPIESVSIHHGSTTLLDEGFGSFHSRSIIMGGNAIADAAEKLISLLKAEVASMFECNADNIQYRNGIFVTPAKDPLALADLARVLPKIAEADGTFGTKRKPYGYGTHAAHVAVDIRTGHVEVVEYVAVEDVGKMINPLLVHGQKIGAIVQGLGGVFLEQLSYDDNAQFLTGSLADYLLPTSTDYPNIRAISLDLTRTDRNPMGVKGVGEDAIAPVAAVIGNAIADALSSFGVQPTRLPLTPCAVWRLMGQSEESEAH
ncbi:carbon monoxide dehydrogenase [Aminobacter sp. DSM 101952]|uniref:xanthine dehydrogenase family protein molybdopterin-binding subunit n=1 Tax=Aminobacter sp. DSM 101952 TaxID=2735891 RepID=UPI0006F76DF0|nr:xanthine dehydrogenase family protein molybdopterin-binding subunit [Aminobacter sp. DSM 101952]KQU71525.1 carbon monoxide dehydrogenase [Aminobacter sp. DSM 101952]